MNERNVLIGVLLEPELFRGTVNLDHIRHFLVKKQKWQEITGLEGSLKFFKNINDLTIYLKINDKGIFRASMMPSLDLVSLEANVLNLIWITVSTFITLKKALILEKRYKREFNLYLQGRQSETLEIVEGVARWISRQLNGEIKKFQAINSTLISVIPSRNDIYFSERILTLTSNVLDEISNLTALNQ